MSDARYNHALLFHEWLPEEEWLSLREYGIPDTLIHARLLGWDNRLITIPVFSYDRQVLFFERAAWTDEGRLEVVPEARRHEALYGAELLRSAESHVILTEGVVESIVLAGQSFTAVSATGSGRSFREEWAPLLRHVREVFVCFKKGKESEEAARRIAALIPQSVVVTYPEVFPEGAGIAEFFVGLGGTRLDFLRLLTLAQYA